MSPSTLITNNYDSIGGGTNAPKLKRKKFSDSRSGCGAGGGGGGGSQSSRSSFNSVTSSAATSACKFLRWISHLLQPNVKQSTCMFFFLIT